MPRASVKPLLAGVTQAKYVELTGVTQGPMAQPFEAKLVGVVALVGAGGDPSGAVTALLHGPELGPNLGSRPW